MYAKHLLGIYFTSQIFQTPNAINAMDEEWETLGNIILCNKSSDEIQEDDKKVIKKIKDFYHGENASSMSKGSLDTIIEMFGDSIVFGPDEYLSSLITSQSAQPLYMYSFDYHGSWKYGDFVTLPFTKLLSQIFLSCFGVKVLVNLK